MTEDQVYPSIGSEGFTILVAAFYRRVHTDDILGPLYPAHDLVAAERRLCDFLIQRFGGPAAYSAARGHPRLRMRHAPFKVDLTARNRWMKLMDEAIVETQIPEEIIAILRPYFDSTATFMINQSE